MPAASILLLALKISLALTVLGLGLRSTPAEATYLARHRGLFARSFLAMSILMPLLAVWLTIVFSLPRAVSLALVALSLSPVPPFLPGKAIRAGGNRSYVIGLFVAAAVVAVIVVPLSVSAIGLLFGLPFQMPPAVVATLVGTSVLVPIGIGMGIRRLSPAIAERAAGPVALTGTILLVATLIPILVTAWPVLRSLIGNGSLAAIAVMTLGGLAAGHLLGGPRKEDRTVLALATASRHPAVAVAIVAANAPSEKIVAAAVVLSLLTGAIASMPYLAWTRRQAASRRTARIEVTEHLVQ